MIPSSVDIIDLSSDSEDDIIDLCSDNEGNSDFLSGGAYDLDFEDSENYFHQLCVSLSTSDQNSLEKPISLLDDDLFNSTQTSSCYGPVENNTTAMSSEVPNLFPSVNHDSSVEMPHGFACAIPNDQCIDDVGKIYVCNDDKKTLPLLLTNGDAVKSEHFSAANGASSDSAHAIPNGQRIDNVGALYSCNDNKRILPSLQTSGTIAKSEHSCTPYGALQLSQSLPRGIPRSFSPQSFASNHSFFGDNKIKEEPMLKSHGFQRCYANGNGTSSSTVSTGPRSHRIFPPPMPSGGSINGVEADNGVENRLLGFNERAVYEEAVKRINQEKKEEDLPKGVMSVSLLKHQKIALAWMISKENNSHCPGGILADDQGLGKTISTIALIQKERVQQSRFMTADLYHTKSVLNVSDDDDVVIIMEDKKKMKIEPKLDDSTPLDVDQSMPAADQMLGTVKVELTKKNRLNPSASALKSNIGPASGTLVVCPASVLKQWANELSVKVMESSKLSVLVYHGASRTRNPNDLAKYDVVVTTYTTVANEVPRENPDDEEKNRMYGICPEFSVGSKRKKPIKTKLSGPLARVRWFRVVLDEAQTIKNYRTQVARACTALSAERRWCLSGTPIQNKIDDLYSYFCFLKYEPYSEFGSFSCMIKNPISRDPARGYKKLQAILRIILLRRTKETLIDGEPIIKLPPKTIELSKIDFTQEERAFYLALEEGSRQKFKAYDAAGTIKDNYANILVLLLRLRQACDHPLLLKGQESDLIDKTNIEMAKKLPKDEVTNLLEKLESGPVICSTCSDPPEDVVVATCGHVFCYQCVHERLTSNEIENVCPSFLCGKKINAGSVFSPGVLKLCTLPKLESDAAASSTPEDELSSICESSYISSKIKAAIDIINSIICTHTITGGDTVKSIPSEIAPVKAIVFSQWTGMLDLLELSLSSNNIQYRRLDGKMSLNIRDNAVKDFNTISEVKVMIMSLKAGNLGLNMVAACHVIMLDPWWNPYAEDQAVDRAHRIGQTRPVTVSRLTVKGTVEDRILNLQEKKRKMVQSAFGEDKSSGNATRLTVEDLRYLFMV